jgi:hypothetical protein
MNTELKSELKPNEQEDKKMNVKVQGGSDAVYGLGLIGAWVYYIGRATTPQERVVGFFKGLVWPAYMVYALFEFLNKK